MSSVKPIPDGCDGIIAHLVVDGANEAIDFYKKAFGAQEVLRMPTPDGKKLLHAEIKIGKSLIYLADDFPEFGSKPRSPRALGGTPFNIHQYTEDTDAAMKRAAEAGATVIMPATDMFWGDRYGKLQDPFGHEWGFSTHIADPTPEEMAKAAAEMFAGAPQG